METINEQIFLEKYKKSIIKESIKILLKNCIVYKDDTELNYDEIFCILLKPKAIKRCLGITNGPLGPEQCLKNAKESLNYCKTHLYKYGFPKDKTIVIENKVNEKLNVDKEFTKKFIHDSHYIIDDEFIYDLETLEKVGYINKGKYIFTDDPFILSKI
jgi:hypothetical protein